MTLTLHRNASLALLTEFNIGGAKASMLAARIDGLIRIAVATERHRCFDVVHRALGDAEGRILKMKTEPQRKFHYDQPS